MARHEVNIVVVIELLNSHAASSRVDCVSAALSDIADAWFVSSSRMLDRNQMGASRIRRPVAAELVLPFRAHPYTHLAELGPADHHCQVQAAFGLPTANLVELVPPPLAFLVDCAVTAEPYHFAALGGRIGITFQRSCL
jgi:hypothetical protein